VGTRTGVEKLVLGLVVAVGLVYVVFVRYHDEIFYASSCDSTVPTNAAQSAALSDLKIRKAAECEGPHKGCQYLISEQPDGTIRIKFWDIGDMTGSECMSQDCCFEDHIYGRDGKYLRCDGCAA